MMRSLIAEGHEPPAWLTEYRLLPAPLTRRQVEGAEGIGPLLAFNSRHPAQGIAPVTDVNRDGDVVILGGDRPALNVVAINPDPEQMPLTRLGRARTRPMNIAFLYQGLVKVVTASECTADVAVDRGPVHIITDGSEHQAQWWTWTVQTPGWYLPDGTRVDAEVSKPLLMSQQAVALRVESVPKSVGLRFSAIEPTRYGTVAGRFEETVSGSDVWNISQWARIAPADEGQPPAPDVIAGDDALAALEGRFKSLTSATAIKAAAHGTDWCREYESVMRDIGIAETDYRRKTVMMRYKVKVALMFTLTPEQLAKVTADKWGGEGHNVRDSVSWSSRVEVEVTGKSSESPRYLVSDDVLKAAGYTGYISHSVTGHEELGQVEEEATAAEEAA